MSGEGSKPQQEAADYAGREQFLRRFCAGDPAAMESVRQWAARIVASRFYSIPVEDRSDIVQQALMTVWYQATRPGFQLRTSVGAFVITVVMARCLDWIRRRRHHVPIADEFEDPQPAAPDTLVRDEALLLVREALRALTDFCREIIREHFLHELPYATLAERRGLAESTMRVHMRNCLRKLRVLMSDGAM